MKLSYSSSRLEKKVASLAAIAKNYGNRAKIINQRLKDLEAARNLEIMKTLGGNCHELTGNLKGKLAISTSGNRRIVFEPSNNPIPVKEDGGLDWSKVTEILITDIDIDYH
jgi:proteic killer suppression protein